MCQKRQREDSLQEEIRKLDREIEKLKEEKQKVHEEWKKLLMEEDITKGKIYSKKLHDLKQKELMLEVEIDYREKKKKRLMWCM